MENEFYRYCISFYGKGGIYDLGVPDVSIKAVCRLIEWTGGEDFAGDSFDREKVRELLEGDYL